MLSYSALNGSIISDDLLRVQVRSADDLGYVYAFLRSRYGRAMMRASRYGSIVKHLEPEHLRDIPVPEPPESVRSATGRNVRLVIQNRDEAFELQSRASSLLVDLLGIPSTGDTATFSVGSRSLGGGGRRLDANHYNPDKEALFALISASGQEVDRLGEVTSKVYGVPRFKHVYQSQGVPYLDSEDLFKLNPELSKFIPRAAIPRAEDYYVQQGWVLMASSGQIYGLNGSVVLSSDWHENRFVSNHVIRIVPEGIPAGYLAALLGHPILGQPLILSLAFGSSVPEIAPEELVEIPIVRLGDHEDEIAELVERASALRSEANRLEDQSVALVEASIGVTD